MARGLFYFSCVLCMVVCGAAGSCIQHSIQAETAELSGAGKALSKDPGFVAGLALTGSSALRRDRSKRTKADEVLPHGGEELKVLRRTKRRWSPLPFNIKENDPPPFPKEVEIIGSDSSANYTVFYRIEGPGATEPPVGLFSVDPNTGMLKVHHSVNREDYKQFIFIARVFDKRTQLETDLPLPITVNVNDVNDNAPQFVGSLVVSVLEHSSAGTEIGKINATDTDEPETLHTKIRYSLLNGTQLFHINPETGVIYTKTATLDREVQDKHFISVKLQDMDGAPNGLSTIGTVTVMLIDINDNPPTFREKKHTGKIEENKADVLLLRIPVDDKDLEKTPNWKAVYVIKKGNENGNFRIETDPITNEGLLYVVKPLDYEATPNIRLEVEAENEAKLVGTKSTWASIPVDIAVINVDEGPEFSAPILSLRVKEDVPNGTLIGTYKATDPETKSSDGIKYYKMSDIASWIDVDEATGRLNTRMALDRESPFVIKNLYNITVHAVDASSKTGTGTVLMLIEDVNDNTPTIPAKEMTLCENEGVRSVLLEAEDKDDHPFSDPFTFQLGAGHDGKWKLTDVTATSARLQPAQDLPTGLYHVPVLVEDLQSFGVVQTVAVRICECRRGECPAQKSSVALGVWAVLAMLLALALLLLLCICCVSVCTTQKEKIYIDDVSTGMLLKSNTEAPGEEVNSGILILPSSALDGSVKLGHMDRLATLSSSSMGGKLNQNHANHVFQESVQDGMFQASAAAAAGNEVSAADARNLFGSGRRGSGHYGLGHYGSGHYGSAHYSLGRFNSGHFSGTMRSNYGEGTLQKYAEFSSLDTWRTNEAYLEKLVFFATEDEGRYADDQPREYEYEGQGSPAGSVGCCSDQADEDGLEFLDALEPKFKTLAELCAPK
ncbi:desmocollin-1-like isoform X3 [Anguilla anguilla]|uniref:desmocollin-1-like isoform X3 n=1 Tax=Anguilla anguilla TaxID=7936 RepID=UPI0015AD4D6E|nr:desmocollin-1-like isoform X3 [Anguilla anguilla]